MNCLSCDNKSLDQYSEDSYMKLPVYFCNICGMYSTGKTEEEIKNRSVEIYKKEYWNERGAEESIKANYFDINSRGKIAIFLGLEGGYTLNQNIDNLYYFHDKGVCYITLA